MASEREVLLQAEQKARRYDTVADGVEIQGISAQIMKDSVNSLQTQRMGNSIRGKFRKES